MSALTSFACYLSGLNVGRIEAFGRNLVIWDLGECHVNSLHLNSERGSYFGCADCSTYTMRLRCPLYASPLEGGQAGLQSIWDKYYDESHAVSHEGGGTR